MPRNEAVSFEPTASLFRREILFYSATAQLAPQPIGKVSASLLHWFFFLQGKWITTFLCHLRQGRASDQVQPISGSSRREFSCCGRCYCEPPGKPAAPCLPYNHHQGQKDSCCQRAGQRGYQRVRIEPEGTARCWYVGWCRMGSRKRPKRRSQKRHEGAGVSGVDKRVNSDDKLNKISDTSQRTRA